jgi:hypothetical protein
MVINIALIQLNFLVFFPVPPGTDMADSDQFNAYIAGLPPTAFIVVLSARLSQAFVGGWIAARFGASHPMILAMIVGTVVLIGGIMAMAMIDGPNWLIIELPLYLVVAWVAGGRVPRQLRRHLRG